MSEAHDTADSTEEQAEAGAAQIVANGSADLFMILDADRAPAFVATLTAGTLVPAVSDPDRLALRLRGSARLVPAPADMSEASWFAALERAAGPDAGTAADAPDRTEALLACIAERLATRADAGGAASGSAVGDRLVTDTLDGFSKLLQGRFHREPEQQPTTAMEAAALRIAGLMKVKAQLTREHGGETTVDFLERFAAGNSLRSRRLRLPPGHDLLDPDLQDHALQDEGPLLVFTAEGQPLVLVPTGTKGYQVEDPFAGTPPCRLTGGLRDALRDDAFAFYKTLPDGKLGFRQILGFGLGTSKWDIALIAFCGIIGSLLAMTVPIASAKITDIGVQSRDIVFLAEIMAVLALVVCIETVFFVIRHLAELRLEGRSAMALQAALADRLMRLPMSAIRGTTKLIMATQMESVERFRRPLLHLATSGTLALIYCLVASVLVASVSPAAGLIAIALVLVLAGASALLGWLQFKAIYEGERMDVVVLAFVYDLIRLVPQLRALGLEKFALTQWGQNFLAFQSRMMRSSRIGGSMAIIEGPWEIIALVVCFIALALAGSAGHMGAGEAIVFVLALTRLLTAGRELSHAITTAAKLLPMAKLGRPFLEYAVEPRRSGPPLPELTGDVELADVSFHHGGRLVLDNLNLSIPDGAFVAIAGPSGSGKTTLLRLITGLDDPQAGAVRIGGSDIRSLDRRQLAKKFGVVMQHGRLFPGSLYANIRGVTEIGLDEAWHFAELAGLADELSAMPMGLRTLVGEAGSLSRGQVQRLLVARALAQRPSILILDEVTASLEGAVQDRLMRTLAGLPMTRLMVAQRRSTLMVADRLVVLDGGRIEDDDHPHAVMTRHPHFLVQS